MNLVYRDLERSTYIFEVDEIKFYFSSLFNLNRFKERYVEYVYKEEKKVISKYHFQINMKRYLLICFYLIIEKRGFLVEIKNKKYKNKDLNFETIFLYFKDCG